MTGKSLLVNAASVSNILTSICPVHFVIGKWNQKMNETKAAYPMEDSMSKLDYDLRSAGAHGHHQAISNTLMGGNHSHILNDFKTLIREGEHTHSMGEGIFTQNDGAHVHEIVMSDGKKAEMETPDGAHTHEVLPDGTTYETGQHTHKVKMPDGTELETLTPAQIRVEVQKREGTPGFWGGVISGDKK